MSQADDIRSVARRRLKARNDFMIMLAIFGVVTLLLLAIWFFSTGLPSNFTAYFWPVWPIIGMSIAAIFAGLDAYGITRRHITEDDIDAEIARMSARKTSPPSVPTA